MRLRRPSQGDARALRKRAHGPPLPWEVLGRATPQSRRRVGPLLAWGVPLGFTLVELLICISIIALLLGIIVPSLKRAKESASGTVCQTRIRALGQTTSAYISDFNRYPPSLMNTPEPWFYGWAGFDWLGAGHSGDGFSGAPQRGLYWRYLKEPQVYRCPADNGQVDATHGRYSFAMNGRTGLQRPDGYVRNKEDRSLPRLADSELPTFFDEAAPLEGCFSGRDLPSLRHGKQSNVGFADGHGESVAYEAGVNANGICRGLKFDPELEVVTRP